MLLGAARVLRADRADVVIERRVAGDLHVEAVGVRQPFQRALHRLAQIRDDGPVHIDRTRRCQGRDQEGGLAVRTNERRFADGADGDDLADVGLARECRRDRVEHVGETRIGVAHGAVHHDRHIFGDGIGKRFADELGGASGLGRLGIHAANREDALHVRGLRHEQQREHCPRADDPAAPADELPRG